MGITETMKEATIISIRMDINRGITSITLIMVVDTREVVEEVLEPLVVELVCVLTSTSKLIDIFYKGLSMTQTYMKS